MAADGRMSSTCRTAFVMPMVLIVGCRAAAPYSAAPAGRPCARRAHADVTAATVMDTVTGLPNRLLLLEHLTRSVERAKRYPDPFAPPLVELDLADLPMAGLGSSTNCYSWRRRAAWRHAYAWETLLPAFAMTTSSPVWKTIISRSWLMA